IFMVLFSILFIEPFYSSPKNVITNTIPLILVFISIQESFKNQMLWWTSISFMMILISMSIIAMALSNKEESENSSNNIISNKLKGIAVLLGNGKVLYSF